MTVRRFVETSLSRSRPTYISQAAQPGFIWLFGVYSIPEGEEERDALMYSPQSAEVAGRKGNKHQRDEHCIGKRVPLEWFPGNFEHYIHCCKLGVAQVLLLISAREVLDVSESVSFLCIVNQGEGKQRHLRKF